MPYFSKSCPTCKKMLPLLCATCPMCDSRTEAARAADDAYNRMITLGMRVSGIACAFVAVTAIRSTGRMPDWADYRLMFMVLAGCACAIWLGLKFVYGSSRRSLWRTALIPSFVIVAGTFVVREVSGRREAVQAATAPALPPAASADKPSSERARAIPLTQFANECIASVQAQAHTAGEEAADANMRAMFNGDSDGAVEMSRARLTQLDRRLRAYDARVRKTSAALAVGVQNARASSPAKMAIVAAVRDSGAQVAKSARECIALQRRVIDKAGAILAFLKDHSANFSTGNRRIVINSAGDTEAYGRLVAEFDEVERRSALALRNLQLQREQAHRHIAAAAGAAPSRHAAVE